jgi:hypothetical protein
VGSEIVLSPEAEVDRLSCALRQSVSTVGRLLSEGKARELEVARLHGLLERADAELPPENPVQQEVSRTLQSCSDVTEGLRAQVELMLLERAEGRRQLAEARKQIEEAADLLRSARLHCRMHLQIVDEMLLDGLDAWLATTAPEGGHRG